MEFSPKLAEILEKGDAMCGRKQPASDDRPQNDENWVKLMRRAFLAFNSQNGLFRFLPFFGENSEKAEVK